jgi:hypothetical protein
MITLIARFRLCERKTTKPKRKRSPQQQSQPQKNHNFIPKKGTTMNSLTQSKKTILSFLIALAFVALVSPTVAHADAVTDWNAIASNAIVTTAGQPPPVSALSFAMVQGAVYDAVNAIDRGHQPYLVQPP